MAIVLITPQYLESRAVAEEFPVLAERQVDGAIPIFRVLAVATPTLSLSEIASGAYAPVNEKPLAEMDEAERRHTFDMLVRDVEIAVEGLAPTSTASPRSKGSPQTNASAASDDYGTVLDSFLATPHLGPVRQVIRRAVDFAVAATPPVTVSTDLVLVAIGNANNVPAEEKWVVQWLLDHANLAEITGRVFSDYQIKLNEPHSADAPELSDGTVGTLDSAARIAMRTSGSGEIRARHLLAALLTDSRGVEDSGALMELGDSELDIQNLRRRFFDEVRGRGDNDSEWSLILLGRELRIYRMAGFHADDTRGEDLLGIEQDVLAFATLVAARSVTPPLSIGLFGEWGSGKSFFMRHLRNAVAGLARDAARSGQMQRELPFYKRIVQIEFNAWHYVEGNLWASLVEHIFRNLSLPGEKPSASEALQKRLIDDLKFTEQAREQAHAERRRALREVAGARKRVSAARREHQRQREKLAELAAKQVADDLTREEVSAAVGPVLERLGIPAVETGVRDLLGALGEARALVERGRGVFLPLVRAPEGERRRRTALLLMVLFLGPVVGWLVGVAVDTIGDTAMAQLSAFASGAATLLTAGAAWVRSQVKWGSDRLAEVEKAQREVDRRLAEKAAEHTRELRALQEKLQLAKADYESARQTQRDAEARVKDAKAKLDEQSVAKLLASFIEDRAQSADYRKHLGVLALVRNDFETLSGLIEEENWRLSPPGHDDGRYPGRQRFATLDEEEKHRESRINRIVLYIDDLDRCPPNKVVEVLQAVHLLLAFPLFVVVVGVDARWVKRSLEVRYRELLHGDGADVPASSAELLIGKATTDDYLEKIFQVPFWLRRMDDTDTADMVRGLLGGSVASEAARGSDSTSRTDDGAAGKQDPVTGTDDFLSAAARQLNAESSARDDSGDGVATPRNVVSRIVNTAAAPAAEREEPQVNLESLVFRPEEVEFITALAPLLDRSPRALKRFVNVYRLIKAGLTPAEQRAFHEAIGQVPPYQAVLFLLAVDTGLPEVADEFFAALRKVHPTADDLGTGEGAATLLGVAANRIEQAGGAFTPAGRPWARIRAWIHPATQEEPRFDPSPALLAAWEPRVTRFSFRAQA
ncbi:MAG TPA: P-loop NTPase fold protein [Longimicrobium sp.]|nr:P-loop NTPase fold protein [Longimicrobium sp.]